MSIRHANEENISQPAVNPRIPDVPDTPSITSASDYATSGTVTVSVSSTATGGTASGFTVTSSPGSFTATGTSPILVSGLTNGSSYTFTAQAVNATGQSAASSASSSITPTLGTQFLTSFKAANYMVIQKTLVDSSGNIYVLGRTNNVGAGSYDIYLAKFNSSNVLQWQRAFGTTGNEYLGDAVLDSSGNIYIHLNYINGAIYNGVFAKYDSSGTVVWQNRIYNSSSYSVSITGPMAVDSSNNIFVPYTIGTGGGQSYVAAIAKYNSSGTLVWSTSYGTNTTSNPNYINGVAVDSSGNVYGVGYASGVGGSGLNGLILKFDSTGALLWQRVLLVGSGYQIRLFGCAVDSSGNLLMNGHGFFSGITYTTTPYLAKINSSGTMQWQRGLTPSGTGADSFGQTPSCVRLDSSDNAYIAFAGYNDYIDSNGDGFNSTTIVKYNSSGTLQWQRRLVIKGYTDYGNSSIEVNQSSILGSNLYYGASTPTATNGFSFAIPTDGSHTKYFPLLNANVYFEASTSATDNTLSLSSYTPTESTRGAFTTTTSSSNTNTTVTTGVTITTANF